MLKRKISLLLTVLMVFGMAGCGSSGAEVNGKQVEGLEELGKIKVISREEGSGTRSVFAELTGFSGTGGQKAAIDLTTQASQIEQNAEAVIETVRQEPSAIGYVSTGALEEAQNVKILSVNGISADEDSIEKGEYPLSRSFYLVYTGKLNELEQDFLTYVKGKGQEIIGKDYVPIAKSSTFLSGNPTGTVTIHGSTSVASMMRELAEQYMQINPNAVIEVEESDSAQGINDALSGNCDFGMTSRELRDYEKELLNYEIVARDGIAVIVNKENPLEIISIDALKEIYTGEITTWDELNP